MQNASENTRSTPPTMKEVYDIMNDIRNMRVLTATQLTSVYQLSHTQLLEIIEIYNVIMQNVNDFFS
jgi:hypothetical protein